MEGGMKIVKILVMAYNIIFVVVGIALIVCGAIIQTRMKNVASIFGNVVSGPGIVLIVFGVIIFIIADFGCLGACRENHCCIMTFAGLLVVILIVEIGCGIAGFVLKDQIENSAVKRLQDSENQYNTSSDVRVVATWDWIQQEFKCCGANNYIDWENQGLPYIPESCCKTPGDTSCKRLFKDPEGIYTDSCRPGVIDWLKNNIILIGGIGIGLAVVQIVGIFLACCLGRAIKKDYKVV